VQKKIANIPKIILGNHTANSGEKVDFQQRTKYFIKNISQKQSRPIMSSPFLLSLYETETAIIVNINAETGTLYFFIKPLSRY
jgi:hypothetical protein